MEYKYVRCKNANAIDIGQQGDHLTMTIVFTDLITDASTVYAKVNYKNLQDGDEEGKIILTKCDGGWGLPIGYPLTEQYGEVKLQLFSATYSNGVASYIKQSGIVTMIVNESLTDGDIMEYPGTPE